MEQRKNTSFDPPPADAVDEATAEDAPTGEDGSFFARRFRIILVALVGVAAVGGAGTAVTQYGRIAQTAAALPFVGGEEAAAGEERDASAAHGTFTELKGLVINPAESGGARYLAVSLAFETTSPEVVKELEAKEVVVRDAVLNLLSQRTVAELSAFEQREALKESLRAATNDLLIHGTVDRLYFTQFVLQ